MRQPRGTGAVRTAVGSFTGSQLNVDDTFLSENSAINFNFSSLVREDSVDYYTNFVQFVVDCNEISMGANLIIFKNSRKN